MIQVTYTDGRIQEVRGTTWRVSACGSHVEIEDKTGNPNGNFETVRVALIRLDVVRVLELVKEKE